jgi:hypothetical protein
MPEFFCKQFIAKIFTDISHLPEFEKDFKKLSKRYKTLEEDLKNFIKTALNAYHKLKIESHGVFHISDIGILSEGLQGKEIRLSFAQRQGSTIRHQNYLCLNSHVESYEEKAF